MVEMNAPCVATGQPATEYLPEYLGLCGDIWNNRHSPQVPIISPTGCILHFLFAARISTACKTVLELSSSSIIIIVTGRVYHFTQQRTKVTDVITTQGNFSSYAGNYRGRSYFLVWSARLSGGACRQYLSLTLGVRSMNRALDTLYPLKMTPLPA